MLQHRKLKNNELGRKSVAHFKEARKTPLILILDNVRSLHNVGSVFRTADAFLLQKIYLCGITATPPHKDIRKTALGATETMEWEYARETLPLLQKLRAENVRILSVEQTENATMLQNFIPKQGETYALVFGNEVKGVQQAVVSASDEVLEIPQTGSKHSLNISVSVGVVVWDLVSKL